MHLGNDVRGIAAQFKVRVAVHQLIRLLFGHASRPYAGPGPAARDGPTLLAANL
jgi:hypothetical protein